jgi:hypothetical protein
MSVLPPVRWCVAFLSKIEYWYDGVCDKFDGSKDEDVALEPLLHRNVRGRLLLPNYSHDGEIRRLQMFNRFGNRTIVAEYLAPYATYIRQNHIDTGNLIWFYKLDTDRWLVEFGEFDNTHMNKYYVSEERVQKYLEEYPIERAILQVSPSN